MMDHQNRFELEGVPLPPGPGAPMLKVMASHVSVRAYKPDPISTDMLNAILVAARSASTSNNLHSYSIIRVTDPDKRVALSEIAGGQRHVRECPELLIFCPDIYRLRLVCEQQGYQLADRKMEMFMQAVVDATIAGQNAAVAAEALGLGIVYIGAIRNNIKEASRILALPPGVFALFGMCLGFPASRNHVKQRLPHAVMVHENVYSTEGLAAELAEYDKTMAASGVYGGRQAQTTAPNDTGSDKLYGWSEHTARRLSQVNPQRGKMMQLLEELGFEF